MNDLIIYNLYEFWRYIGKLNSSLTEAPDFSAVSMKNSDWPNRIFDSKNNTGLHIIGTLPKARGKGIGNRMTEKLMLEAKDMGTDLCVLHASVMGMPIYKKLGFQSFGSIETYSMLK